MSGEEASPMTEAERAVRETLVRLIRQAGIFGLLDDNLEAAFISGGANPALKDIGIDSLSEMELCIGIENELGVSIVPAELSAIENLNSLLDRIQDLKTSRSRKPRLRLFDTRRPRRT